MILDSLNKIRQRNFYFVLLFSFTVKLTLLYQTGLYCHFYFITLLFIKLFYKAMFSYKH